PGLRERTQWFAARQAGEGVLAHLPPSPPDGSSISLTEAVTLLDQADYRLIRSNNDLLEAVCEALALVEQDVAADLPMRSGRPSGKGEPRRRLNEDALQAYVRRRLLDLLPGRVFDPRVRAAQVVREDQVRYRRLDLRVTAPCRPPQDLATVVIEVKWSDNDE